MKKSELLKLKEGKYLATDSICNYLYVINKYKDKEGLIASIKERGSFSSNNITLIYSEIQSFDDEYDRFIPRKRIDTSVNIAGIFVNSKGAFDVYNKLNIIGIYNEDTFREDFNSFKLHHKINMSKRDRKFYYKLNR